MTTSYGHDQDPEPPTPGNQESDVVESDSDGGDTPQGGAQMPASHPDPEPGAHHAQTGGES
jgi:hypothetical protein